MTFKRRDKVLITINGEAILGEVMLASGDGRTLTMRLSKTIGSGISTRDVVWASLCRDGVWRDIFDDTVMEISVRGEGIGPP